MIAKQIPTEGDMASEDIALSLYGLQNINLSLCPEVLTVLAKVRISSRS